MGQTAECEVEIDGKADRGQALLETRELVFRGARRVRVPFAAMKKVSAKAGALAVTWRTADDGGVLVLTLGARAAIWADKIKNPPGRLDKLGVKPGMNVAVWGALEPDVLAELQARAEVHLGKPRGGEALVFVVAERPAELERIAIAAGKIARDGAVWLIRHKGKDAPVSEAASMAAGKAAGLVDTKVAALSAAYTAERYVIPVRAR